jgi:hypothetical protein
MGIFSRKSKFVGQPVHVNDSGTPPEQRYERSKERVYNLERKLIRLERREKKSSDVLTAIDQTRFAIEEWRKRMKMAEFELDLYKETK